MLDDDVRDVTDIDAHVFKDLHGHVEVKKLTSVFRNVEHSMGMVMLRSILL